MIGNEKEGLTLIQTVILFPQTVIEEIAFWYLLLRESAKFILNSS